MSIAIPPTLEKFAREGLKNYDASHDYSHSLRVWNNALRIIEGENPAMTAESSHILMYACILHDVVDHKYGDKNVYSLEDIRAFVNKEIGAGDIVIDIITNISWSKRHVNKKISCERLRQITQCADWLDALGEVGINRCIEYTKFKSYSGNDSPTTSDSEVCKHIEEKLIKMKDELCLPRARDLAEPLHNQILKWYETHRIDKN